MPVDVRELARSRATDPGAVAAAAAARRRPDSLLGPTGRLMVVAADHTARGVLGAGTEPAAMADRERLLDRLCLALSRPEVNGVLGTADVLDDLLLLGALEDKVVLGSMNRGGLAGASFEIDDRYTGYRPAGIDAAGFEGGKMLLRIEPDDPASAQALESCADAVSDLSARGLMAMVEPFFSRRVAGALRNDLSTEAVVRSVSVAAALGSSSAHTWLKLPVVTDGIDGMARVLAASTLPAVLLGGEVPDDPAATFAAWGRILQLPTAMGLVIGRALLYPADDDVAGAVDRAVSLL